MAQEYFSDRVHALDREYYSKFFTGLDRFGPVSHPVALHEEDGGAKSNLGPRELGATINPFQNQIQALQAKIKEGAGRLEIGFGGVGKGNSQSQTPEAYGTVERDVLRQLAEYNDIRTSTHASFQLSGLAGFDPRNGFSKERQHVIMEEVKKAVDFASQATTGGAIVVHTGEWARPMSEMKQAREEFRDQAPEGDRKDWLAYRSYPDEEKKAVIPIVDERTGRMIEGVRKDQELYEPNWYTIENYERLTGKKIQKQYADGKPIEKSLSQFNAHLTYVDADGRVINPGDEQQYEKRVPHLRADGTFDTKIVRWDELEKRAAEERRAWKERTGKDKEINAEVLFYETQLDNAILQQLGNRMYYEEEYQDLKKARTELLDALERAKEQERNLPANEKWKIERQVPGIDIRGMGGGALNEFVPSKTKTTTEILQEQLDQLERQMRHTVQRDASRDSQVEQYKDMKKHLKTLEEYGLSQSGQALGELGVYAFEKTKQMRTDAEKRGVDPKKYDDLYIAPENVFSQEYGSHPDELMNVIRAGRAQMVEKLKSQYHLDAKEAEKLAKEHIKSTIDIGHLNMWKTHMTRFTGESDEQFHARFEKWALGKVDQMHKEGMIGHVHLTDNLGFNDEHLTPGQGNAPIRSFVKKLEDLGYKDFISEIGSFNANTILPETWSFLGSRHFTRDYTGPMAGGNNFGAVHTRHFGSYAPPMYMFGSYAPSNDFTLWSGIPLE